MLAGSDANDSFVTPFVTRHLPKLAPPSTAHLPSQFMPMSSPAPFWKYADFGSTPARPAALDLSPIKQQKDELVGIAGDDTLRRPNNSMVGINSSSPPPADIIAADSPSRSVATRNNERLADPAVLLTTSETPALQKLQHNQPVFSPTQVSKEVATVQSGGEDDEEEEDNGGMIDLAR